MVGLILCHQEAQLGPDSDLIALYRNLRSHSLPRSPAADLLACSVRALCHRPLAGASAWPCPRSDGASVLL